MAENSSRQTGENDTCIHIFAVSAAMVGVCLTVIELCQIVTGLNRVGTLADNLLAVDALVFLVACVFSYAALRTRGQKRNDNIERVADIAFLLGLSGMVIICSLITYALV
jgi:Na+/alanine symporter